MSDEHTDPFGPEQLEYEFAVAQGARPTRRRDGLPPTARSKVGPLPGRCWSANAIQRVSTTHEQVMNWLLLNPEKSMRQCADHFGYTQVWLSQLVHSDLFQAALKEKQERIFSRVTQTITEKLQGVADIALDKLAEKVADSEDPDFILEAADKTLHRLGYAPVSARNPVHPTQVNNTNNLTVNVSSNDLAAARELMRQVGQLKDITPEPAPDEPLSLPEGDF